MNSWELIDCLNALDDDQDNPRIPIHSESQLRNELHRLAQRPPGLVYLASPDQDRLALSIGGPLAALGWTPPPFQRQRVGDKVALPNRVASPKAVDFVAEGIPTPVKAEELFPVEEVIEAAVHFYKTHQLPDWVGWRTWNPATKKWDIERTANGILAEPTSFAKHLSS
jgi:hypothetical protein